MKNENPAPMTDAEMTEKLKKLERANLVILPLIIIGIAAGIVTWLVSSDIRFGLIVFFVIVAAAILIGRVIDNKKKKLINSHFGEYFAKRKAEVFGEPMHTPEFVIDADSIKKSKLIDTDFNGGSASGLYEGICKNHHFSAANAYLTYSFDERPGSEDSMSRTVTILDGFVLTLETRTKPDGEVRLRARCTDEKGGIRTENDEFNSRFFITADSETDAFRLLTPNFMELIFGLEKLTKGKLAGLRWSGNTITMALNTKYRFGEVPPELYTPDADFVRKTFDASLESMEKIIVHLTTNTALF